MPIFIYIYMSVYIYVFTGAYMYIYTYMWITVMGAISWHSCRDDKMTRTAVSQRSYEDDPMGHC